MGRYALALHVSCKGGVEAPDDVEHNRAIRDVLAKIAEGICHVHEMPTIFHNR